MTNAERVLKRRLQWLVGGAMTALFVLVTVLVFQFAVRLNQRVQETALTKEHDRLVAALERENNFINYMDTEKFIEEFALKVLGWGKDGQTPFK